MSSLFNEPIRFMLRDTIGFMLQELFISVTFMLIFLVIQLYLYIKVKSTKIKLIPLYLIIIATILAILIATSNDLDAYVISVLLGAFISIPGLVGIVVAWIAHEIYKTNY